VGRDHSHQDRSKYFDQVKRYIPGNPVTLEEVHSMVGSASHPMFQKGSLRRDRTSHLVCILTPRCSDLSLIASTCDRSSACSNGSQKSPVGNRSDSESMGRVRWPWAPDYPAPIAYFVISQIRVRGSRLPAQAMYPSSAVKERGGVAERRR
jgi:hypothetical protein